MTINEVHLEGLDNNPIRVHKKQPPQSINKNLPPLFFTLMAIGSKGSGKTYSIVKLLKLYEKFPIYDIDNNKLDIRVVLFCPTGHSQANAVFKTLRDLDEKDIHLEYTDEVLKSVLEDIENEKKEIEAYAEYEKAYKRFLKLKVKDLTDDDYLILMKFNLEPLENIPKPKYKHPRVVFIIFDDLVGDPLAFKKSNNAGLNNLTIKHRHLQTNLIFTTQYPKAIPPLIRRNIDIYILFKFANKTSIIEGVYPEVSGILTEEKFTEFYEHSTKEPHDCFIVINHNMVKKSNSFRKNWDISLEFSNDTNNTA
jgi:hypothetical protein